MKSAFEYHKDVVNARSKSCCIPKSLNESAIVPEDEMEGIDKNRITTTKILKQDWHEAYVKNTTRNPQSIDKKERRKHKIRKLIQKNISDDESLDNFLNENNIQYEVKQPTNNLVNSNMSTMMYSKKTSFSSTTAIQCSNNTSVSLNCQQIHNYSEQPFKPTTNTRLINEQPFNNISQYKSILNLTHTQSMGSGYGLYVVGRDGLYENSLPPKEVIVKPRNTSPNISKSIDLSITRALADNIKEHDEDVNSKILTFDMENAEGQSLAEVFRMRRRNMIKKLEKTMKMSKSREVKERSKEEILTQRREMMKSKVKDSRRNNRTTISARLPLRKEPSQKLLERLRTGEKVKMSKEEMRKLTKKNYDLLPEVKMRREQERKKEELKMRIDRARKYEKVFSHLTPSIEKD